MKIAVEIANINPETNFTFINTSTMAFSHQHISISIETEHTAAAATFQLFHIVCLHASKSRVRSYIFGAYFGSIGQCLKLTIWYLVVAHLKTVEQLYSDNQQRTATAWAHVDVMLAASQRWNAKTSLLLAKRFFGMPSMEWHSAVVNCVRFRHWRLENITDIFIICVHWLCTPCEWTKITKSKWYEPEMNIYGR